jgi:hypothetical protein
MTRRFWPAKPAPTSPGANLDLSVRLSPNAPSSPAPVAAAPTGTVVRGIGWLVPAWLLPDEPPRPDGYVLWQGTRHVAEDGYSISPASTVSYEDYARLITVADCAIVDMVGDPNDISWSVKIWTDYWSIEDGLPGTVSNPHTGFSFHADDGSAACPTQDCPGWWWAFEGLRSGAGNGTMNGQMCPIAHDRDGDFVAELTPMLLGVPLGTLEYVYSSSAGVGG